MAIDFKCPACGMELSVGDEFAGRRGVCKQCGASITVPPKLDLMRDPAVLVTPDAAPGPAPIAAPPPPAADARPQPPPAAAPTGQILPAAPGQAAPAASSQRLALVNEMVERGKFLEATQALRELQASAGNHPGYYYLAGLANAGLGNYPLALDNMGRAISGGVRTARAYAAKGKAELETGRAVEAIESFDTALDLAGTDVPDYMADLAKSYEIAKMPRDAAATWNALASINPNHPALLERKRHKEERRSQRHGQQVQQAMLTMQKERRASDTACWVCIILRILLECC